MCTLLIPPPPTSTLFPYTTLFRSLHCGCFDEEDVATDRRPRQARGNTDLIALEQLFLEDFWPAEKLIEVVGMDFADLLFANRHLLRNLAANRGDFALEVSQARFLRVEVDHGAEAFIRKLDLALLQAMLFDLLRNEMAFRDFDLLFFRVAAERDDLHAVAECRLDRVQHVRGRDEHHIREIKRHAEIVVSERMVLLRIEDF